MTMHNHCGARQAAGECSTSARACRRPLRKTRELTRTSCSASMQAAGTPCGRRQTFAVLLATVPTLLAVSAPAAAETSEGPGADLEALAAEALQAYNDKRLEEAYEKYSAIVRALPDSPVWRERRGQVLVDLKRFDDAIAEFDEAERVYKRTVDAKYVSLGLLSNRALAYEGLYDWQGALSDYDTALRLAAEVGYSVPYVINSRGNCHASLAVLAGKDGDDARSDAEWDLALSDYRAATQSFQRSRNLSGAIFAASNAALVIAQQGRDAQAIKELQAAARRAPGSIDMRAALAALLWAAGKEEKAEELWGYACSNINSGQLVQGGPVLDSCSKYADADWLGRIRRWPPVMVKRMSDFLNLREPTRPATI